MMNNRDNKYDDIINLPHHVSDKHPQMSILNRAAQFAPFAALTGYGDAVNETARLTDKKIELDDSSKEFLDAKLSFIQEHIDEQPQVTITYFQKDPLKEGGKYLQMEGQIKKIDEINHAVIFIGGMSVAVDDILNIEGNFPFDSTL